MRDVLFNIPNLYMITIDFTLADILSNAKETEERKHE